MPVCILFSFGSKNVCLMYSKLSCGGICVKASQLRSLWGRNGAEKTEKERKTNIGNMAMNRTLLERGLSCPAGTSGTAVTPRVIKWSLTPQQLFTRADSLGGDSKRKHLRSD